MIIRKFYRYLNAAVMKLDNFQMQRCRKSEQSFVAMFHDVVEKVSESREDRFAITVENLNSFLDSCEKQGYEIISIDELLSGCIHLRKKVVITFDDGFESLYTMVDPLFRQREIPYTIFLTTSFVGQPGYLSQDQLKQVMQNKLCTIAMHADQHKMYRYESDACLKDNYLKCQRTITEITGTVPVHFAFPYGSVYACSKHNRDVLKKLGAKSVFVTRQKMLKNRDLADPYSIPRLNIPGYYNHTVKREYWGLDICVNE